VSERYLDETQVFQKRFGVESMFGLCMVNRLFVN